MLKLYLRFARSGLHSPRRDRMGSKRFFGGYMAVLRWGIASLLLMTTGCAQQPVIVVASEQATSSIELTEASIERSVETQLLPAKQTIRIDNPFGDVRVRFGGYESTVEWRTVAQNAGASNKIAVTGGGDETFLISARLPDGVALAPGQRIEITAYVPIGHDLDIITERGLIEARGVQANFRARSVAGNIAFRGISGLIDVETGTGNIEGQIDKASAATQQRVATSTGNIVLGLVVDLNATLKLATSGVFATEFSVNIDPQAGAEPNKIGHAVIGKPEANIEVVSKRGEIRLLRRLEFRPA